MYTVKGGACVCVCVFMSARQYVQPTKTVIQDEGPARSSQKTPLNLQQYTPYRLPSGQSPQRLAD